MAAKITKKYQVNASGILHIDGEKVFIEDNDSGECVSLENLFEDFADKDIKLSINYGEDY